MRDSRSTSEKQTQRASTRSRAVFFEKVSVYGPKMMCETSERGTAGTRTRAMSSSQGQAQPGQAQHGAGGCACPTACGLVWGGGAWRAPEEKRENDALFIRPRAPPPLPKLPLDDVPPREDAELPSPGCTTSVLPTAFHFSERPSLDSTSHFRPRLARP